MIVRKSKKWTAAAVFKKTTTYIYITWKWEWRRRRTDIFVMDIESWCSWFSFVYCLQPGSAVWEQWRVRGWKPCVTVEIQERRTNCSRGWRTYGTTFRNKQTCLLENCVMQFYCWRYAAILGASNWKFCSEITLIILKTLIQVEQINS